MATRKKINAPPQPAASRLAPELDPDLAELYFNASATIEQRLLLVGLQQLRILRELQAAGRAAKLELSLERDPKGAAEKKRKPRAA